MALRLLENNDTSAPVDDYEEARAQHADMRAKLRAVDAEISAIQSAEWQDRQNTGLDDEAHALLAGDDASSLRPDRDARLAQLRAQRPVIARASQIAAGRFDELRKQRQRDEARALRPEHRAAVRDIHRALRLLSDANDRERALRNRTGGHALGVLPALSLGAVGSLSDHASPAQSWLRAVSNLPEYADILADGGD